MTRSSIDFRAFVADAKLHGLPVIRSSFVLVIGKTQARFREIGPLGGGMKKSSIPKLGNRSGRALSARVVKRSRAARIPRVA